MRAAKRTYTAIQPFKPLRTLLTRTRSRTYQTGPPLDHDVPRDAMPMDASRYDGRRHAPCGCAVSAKLAVAMQTGTRCESRVRDSTITSCAAAGPCVCPTKCVCVCVCERAAVHYASITWARTRVSDGLATTDRPPAYVLGANCHPACLSCGCPSCLSCG
jgi:hypothetical protein